MNADMMVSWALNWAGHTGMDISILIVLVLMCRRPFVKMFGARAAYALWALPLLRLVLPETPITLPRPSWLQTAANTPTEIITYMNVETIVTGPVSTPFNWQLPAIGIWLGVAIIWFAAQIFRQQKYIHNVQADSSPVSPQIRNKLQQACKSLDLGVVPKICMSASNVGPFVTGVIRPVIVLPENFEKDFGDRQQFFALTHELAHIKRGDLWAAFGALVFRALNWPNPLVHYCAVKFRTDQEAACDAYVLNVMGGGVQTKQNYAETLIHSAKVAAKMASTSTKNSTRTSTNPSVLVNPLCLTIYHPLKERLMTLKTSKNNSTILSRVGVGAFLIAALAATAPITIAADGPAAEAPKAKTETKKVMKWIEKHDGEETNKHIEVTVKDGVTTAYSIDKDGNKTEIDASELELAGDFDGFEGLEGLSEMKVFVTDDMLHEKHIKIINGKLKGLEGLKALKGLKGLEGLEGLKDLQGLADIEVFVTDGKEGKHKVIIKELKDMDGKKGKHMKHMKVIKGADGDHVMHMKDDGHSKVIIKRISKGEDGTEIDVDSDFRVFTGKSDSNFSFVTGDGNHAAAMVGAAQGLLDQAEAMSDGKDLSSKARKKLAKARKALKEAQEALEAEE